MARQLKVLAVSLLLACLFALPVYADFTVNDSNTLNNIKINVQTAVNNQVALENRLIDIHSRLVSISNNLNANFASLLTDTTNLQSQLASILSALSALGVKNPIRPDYESMYLAFDTSYYPSSRTSSTYPFMVYAGGEYCNFFYTSRPIVYFIEPGDYILYINTSVDGGSRGYAVFAYSDKMNLYFSQADYVDSQRGIYRYQFTFHIDEPGLYFYDCMIWIPGASSYYASMYMYQLDQGEQSVADQFSNDFSQKSDDLDSGIAQLESQEDSIFQSLDTSIGSFDFSGSALGQVVSGFSFIRAVFSAVYSSSPYISVLINLSCMLGVLALFLRVQPRFSRWEREHRDRDS